MLTDKTSGTDDCPYPILANLMNAWQVWNSAYTTFSPDLASFLAEDAEPIQKAAQRVITEAKEKLKGDALQQLMKAIQAARNITGATDGDDSL